MKTAQNLPERPLFIPLKRAFFEAFARGEKKEEYRRIGARWNYKTCRLGRAVVLSCGYGTARRLRGEITGFRVENNPESLPGWLDCYGPGSGPAAVISICVPDDVMAWEKHFIRPIAETMKARGIGSLLIVQDGTKFRYEMEPEAPETAKSIVSP